GPAGATANAVPAARGAPGREKARRAFAATLAIAIPTGAARQRRPDVGPGRGRAPAPRRARARASASAAPTSRPGVGERPLAAEGAGH
ncbi:MAG TPA: hypothetical protein VFS00_07435, partial [Polyangiaceae bacterium]|nr:hypothetical protein [Polyangiaceae bacterium]